MRVSGSKWDLLSHCGYWAQEGVPWDTSSGRAAAIGTWCHSAMERHADPFAEPEFPELTPEELSVAERKVVHAIAWFNANVEGAIAVYPEAAFAWNPETGEVVSLGGGLRRDYSSAPTGWVTCTLDLVWISADGSATHVADYKFGHEAPPADSLQLAFGALMAMAKHGEYPCVTHVVHGTEERVYDATYSYDSRFALDRKFARLLARAEGSPPTPGDHCRGMYCPAFNACPEVKDRVESAVDLIPAQALLSRKYSLSTDIEDDAHAAWMLGVIPLVEEACERVRGSLKSYADKHDGVELGNGQTWRRGESSRSSMDAKALEAVARANGATDQEIQACTRKATFPVYKAVGRKAKGEAA